VNGKVSKSSRENCTIGTSVIYGVKNDTGTCPFDFPIPSYAQAVNLTINSNKQATVKAKIGSLDYTDFLIDLSSELWAAWATDCTNYEGRQCSA
jgi:hypothetical protein